MAFWGRATAAAEPTIGDVTGRERELLARGGVDKLGSVEQQRAAVDRLARDRQIAERGGR